MTRQATEFVPPARRSPLLRDFGGFKILSVNTPAGDVGVGFFGPFPPGLVLGFLDIVFTAASASSGVLHIGVFASPVVRTDFLTSVVRHLIGGEDTASPSTGAQFIFASTAGSQMGAFRLNLDYRVESATPYLGVRMTAVTDDAIGVFSLGSSA